MTIKSAPPSGWQWCDSLSGDPPACAFSLLRFCGLPGAASLDVSTQALDEILRELDRERDLCCYHSHWPHWHWPLELLGEDIDRPVGEMAHDPANLWTAWTTLPDCRSKFRAQNGRFAKSVPTLKDHLAARLQRLDVAVAELEEGRGEIGSGYSASYVR